MTAAAMQLDDIPSLMREARDEGAETRRALRGTMNVVCARCEKKFEAKMDHGKLQKYCCRSCFCASAKFDNCQQCKKRFRSSKRSTGEYSKFCSRKCFLESKVVARKRVCEQCGRDFADFSTTRRSRFCSVDCRNAFMTGPNSPAWKGGSYVDVFGCVVMNVSTKRFAYSQEHRIVAAQLIGRPLRKTEICIHIDGDKKNNEPGNLFLYQTMSEWKTEASEGRYPTRSNLVPLTYRG